MFIHFILIIRDRGSRITRLAYMSPNSPYETDFASFSLSCDLTFIIKYSNGWYHRYFNLKWYHLSVCAFPPFENRYNHSRTAICSNNTNKNLNNNYPLSIIFVVSLLFELGYRGLCFASRTNLESGPQFAKV